jgi:DNA-binding HxlR family transcriptional regulator
MKARGGKIAAQAGIVSRPAAVRKTLEIFSDPWTFAVLQEIFFGVRKFDEIQKNLGISRSVLTRRLNHLMAKKVIRRKLYSSHRRRFDYKLTERGLAMYPLFLLLKDWGERWLESAGPRAAGPLKLSLTHAPCGHELEVELVCRRCSGAVNGANVTYTTRRRKNRYQARLAGPG